MNGIALDQQPQGIGADPDEVLTIQQAASMLKVSYSHMLRLVRGEINGMPPVYHVRAGRSLRVRRGALTDWIRHVEKLGATRQFSNACNDATVCNEELKSNSRWRPEPARPIGKEGTERW